MQRNDVNQLIREYSRSSSLNDALKLTGAAVLRSKETAKDVFPSRGLYDSVDSLCRCRGMVQEICPDITLFSASRDTFLTTSDCDAPGELIEATLLYVIPVPGNTHFYNLCSSRDSAGSAECPPVFPNAKREREIVVSARLCDTDGTPSTRVKLSEASPCCDRGGTLPENGSVQKRLNLPHPPRSPLLQTACIVTLVGRTNSLPFKINDVVDFYGYVQVESGVGGPSDELFDDLCPWHARELSRGLVSNLLCFTYELLPHSIMYASSLQESVLTQRQRSVQTLSSALCGGDELAAEYLLLHLCGGVHTFSNGTPLGDLPLLLVGESMNAQNWSDFLSNVSPIAEVYIDVGRTTGVRPCWTPQHDVEKNYLQTGLLQVANGTHVTFNCDSLNMQDTNSQTAFHNLIHKQVLQLQYPFQKVEVPINVSVLALSSNLTDLDALFCFPLCVKWTPTCANALPTPSAAGNDDELDAVRSYVARVRDAGLDEAASPEIQSYISETLLGLSEALEGWNNREPLLHNNTFSIFVALARTYSMSMGRSCVTQSDVDCVASLEKRRHDRISAVQ
ncbi:E2F target protein 1 [Strigomonas culicis]|uniref:E2F target protein 1 n=1 Tax=Strigomonas culicis TaxID=28005 RepID=S9UR99_9TRYP|nr:E2F target protein 1 [Strigomonas culicis]EPY28591.1 E2F target protein 1 [Strigomonas culicis]EPY33462.1 E2F target protein 1 [Strigomonas culicis]|eukprot:EPY18582.1 E2F target protein 1 [Strigomonas culicis]